MKRKERLYKKREKQTSDIIYYGLWQNNKTLEQMLQSIHKVSEKRKALVAQLRFRQTVLKQVVKDKAIFNATSKGKPLSIEQLTVNVQKLINDAATVDKQPKHAPPPFLVGKKVKHTFNEGMFTGRVISTVPGFQDFFNIVYDHDLDEHGNVTEATAIYTYKLMNDYKANKLEVIPEVVSGISKHESELLVDETRSFISFFKIFISYPAVQIVHCPSIDLSIPFTKLFLLNY